MSIKQSSPANAFAGFTLIELLMALTIGALVLVSAYASFSFGIKVHHRIVETSRELQETRYFLAQLSEELRSSVSFQPDSFHGDNHRIRFRSFLPRELTALTHGKQSGNFSKRLQRFSSILEIEYSVSEKADSAKIIKIVSNLRGEVVEQSTYHLGLGRVRFFYKAHGKEDSDWLDAWGGSEEFPGLVKIDMDFQNSTLAANETSRQKIIVMPTRLIKKKQESETK